MGHRFDAVAVAVVVDVAVVVVDKAALHGVDMLPLSWVACHWKTTMLEMVEKGGLLRSVRVEELGSI